MRILINNVDVSSLIAYKGVQWTRNDYCPKSVTTMDGRNWRGRVASKDELSITFLPLTTEQLNDVLNLVKDEYFSVTYDDPIEGFSVKTMYAESLPAKLMVSKRNGTEYWNEVTITLKER